jgi:hypothetical protein
MTNVECMIFLPLLLFYSRMLVNTRAYSPLNLYLHGRVYPIRYEMTSGLEMGEDIIAPSSGLKHSTRASELMLELNTLSKKILPDTTREPDSATVGTRPQALSQQGGDGPQQQNTDEQFDAFKCQHHANTQIHSVREAPAPNPIGLHDNTKSRDMPPFPNASTNHGVNLLTRPRPGARRSVRRGNGVVDVDLDGLCSELVSPLFLSPHEFTYRIRSLVRSRE